MGKCFHGVVSFSKFGNPLSARARDASQKGFAFADQYCNIGRFKDLYHIIYSRFGGFYFMLRSIIYVDKSCTDLCIESYFLYIHYILILLQ